MNSNLNALNFSPWVSEAYNKNSGIYGKILIIGESHYFDDEEEDENLNVQNDEEQLQVLELKIPKTRDESTITMIEGYINRKWDINFYRNLGLAFNNKNRFEVWGNVAFANGIQKGLKSSICQPSKDEIATFIPAFWALLESLKPDKVLICSQRMWQKWMPDNDKRSSNVSSINKNGKHSTIWKYNYSGGNCIAMGINHPSKYFSYDKWAPIISEFINL